MRPIAIGNFSSGTHNYLAGRAAGKLVKEAIPEGGDVMIFVGMMEQLNAQQRSAGVIDELLDKPIPEDIARYLPATEVTEEGAASGGENKSTETADDDR